ncbi:MAG TPA: MFS transporter [Ktedonobacteraceae bacterium]|nr:MFS transporter [Ktedonobacteraceae bacterium]
MLQRFSNKQTLPPPKKTSWVTGDGWRVIIARGVRNFGYGFTSVLLGVTLAAAGFSTVQVGLLLSVALVGDIISIILVALFADRLGRRRVLAFFTLLMGAAGVAFALSQNVVILLLAAFFGIISPSNSENTPFSTIEQAILPQTTSPERRTDVFARYNIVAQVAGATGGLAVGLPDLLHSTLGLNTTFGIHAMFALYALLALATCGLFLSMSKDIEPEPMPAHIQGDVQSQNSPVQQKRSARPKPLQKSRGIVLRLASLFALDAFAGGLAVQTILALWFHLRFGTSLSLLGLLFFGTNLLAALSFPVAAWLAKRIGLLNTMVFTHLPSNILLIMVPLMPVFPLAALFLLGRQALSQMDVPTRQAYTMTLVAPEERTAAASVTTLARSIALTVSPLLAGILLSGPALVLGLPFLCAGSLKVVYDLSLYRVFSKVKLS